MVPPIVKRHTYFGWPLALPAKNAPPAGTALLNDCHWIGKFTRTSYVETTEMLPFRPIRQPVKSERNFPIWRAPVDVAEADRRLPAPPATGLADRVERYQLGNGLTVELAPETNPDLLPLPTDAEPDPASAAPYLPPPVDQGGAGDGHHQAAAGRPSSPGMS